MLAYIVRRLVWIAVTLLSLLISVAYLFGHVGMGGVGKRPFLTFGSTDFVVMWHSPKSFFVYRRKALRNWHGYKKAKTLPPWRSLCLD